MLDEHEAAKIREIVRTTTATIVEDGLRDLGAERVQAIVADAVARATVTGATAALQQVARLMESMLSSAFHWPSMWANSKTKGFTGDEATFKALTMEQFKSTFKSLARAQASELVAKKFADGAKTEIIDDATFVTLASPMGTIIYTAKSIDGGWFIIRLAK